MTEKLRKHFRDSMLIPFATPEQLQKHIDWLNLQLEGCDPVRDNPRRHWLLEQRWLAKQETAWRQNRDMFEHTGSDGEG